MAAKFWQPIMDLIARYEERLPPWLRPHTRWIGIVILSLFLGALAYFGLSFLGELFPENWFIKLLDGDM